jgi:hypothetical protein
VWWLRDAIHPLAAIAAGAAVYPLALWTLGGIDDDDWFFSLRHGAGGATRDPGPA